MTVDSEILKSLITPNGITIGQVFSNKKRFYIDIYQRDYKWEKSQVETLLKDIELRFNFTERLDIELKNVCEDVIKRFKPYFLNTYLTCRTANNVSIIDGQQRLTTLLIIFIRLQQLVSEIHNNRTYNVRMVSIKMLNDLIFEEDDFGDPKFFKIYNENRQGAFRAILNETKNEYRPVDETQKRIIDNYNTISKYFNEFFKSDSVENEIDVNKLTYYIYYLLEKLNIVEIKIEQQENVATIFEVVNDRGLGLKSYEILKGKLIGNLENHKKEEANNVWTDLQNQYYNSVIKNSTENTIDLDTFFKLYFRAKFADSEADYKKFEDKYHYEIYQNNKILNYFNRFEDNESLYSWVMNEFKYFAELHLRIRTTYENEYLIYNKLLDQNQQYLLLLSAIKMNDPHEKEKINFISQKFDQFHTVIRLLDIYESNSFQDFIYKLNRQIRNQSIEKIEKIFDHLLIEYLEQENIIVQDTYNTISELFKWELLQNVRHRWLNFSKYVLMRIDRYLGETLDKPSYCLESLEKLEDRFNKNKRKIYGMHLEHIYAYNEKNIDIFKDDKNIFDETGFNTVRNMLGMVLLLKDSQNISSNNDIYKYKMEDYATSNIIWNELLVGHFDSVDIKHLPKNLNITKIDPNDNGVFPKNMVETRQKELVEMIKLIWGF